jgi:FKBP-type peptidyl-prolyl cis-trans isomerase
MIKNNTITVLAFILLSLMTFSCEKDSHQAGVDSNLIEAYVSENNLDGEFTSSGLYYVIIQPGTTDHPTINSSVNCSYKGYTLDNVIFDENDFITFGLSQVIAGWQEGIQLIGKGGKIKLIIPSALAYGSGGSGSIGPNEVLAFDVTLNDF